MTQAKKGDTVKVHYCGRFEDGTQFDTSEGSDPLEFEIGAEQVIPGFEDAAIGMTPGDKATVTIPADKAYGPYREEMIMVAPREQIPPEFEPEVGHRVELKHTSGQTIAVVVTEVTEESITLDGNHPLAGHALTFDLELVEIV